MALNRINEEMVTGVYSPDDIEGMVNDQLAKIRELAREHPNIKVMRFGDKRVDVHNETALREAITEMLQEKMREAYTPEKIKATTNEALAKLHQQIDGTGASVFLDNIRYDDRDALDNAIHEKALKQFPQLPAPREVADPSKAPQPNTTTPSLHPDAAKNPDLVAAYQRLEAATKNDPNQETLLATFNEHAPRLTNVMEFEKEHPGKRPLSPNQVISNYLSDTKLAAYADTITDDTKLAAHMEKQHSGSKAENLSKGTAKPKGTITVGGDMKSLDPNVLTALKNAQDRGIEVAVKGMPESALKDALAAVKTTKGSIVHSTQGAPDQNNVTGHGAEGPAQVAVTRPEAGKGAAIGA